MALAQCTADALGSAQHSRLPQSRKLSVVITIAANTMGQAFCMTCRCEPSQDLTCIYTDIVFANHEEVSDRLNSNFTHVSTLYKYRLQYV